VKLREEGFVKQVGFEPKVKETGVDVMDEQSAYEPKKKEVTGEGKERNGRVFI